MSPYVLGIHSGLAELLFCNSTFWVGDRLGRDLDRQPEFLFCIFYIWVAAVSRPDADRQRAAVRLGANESEHAYYYFTTVGGMLPELI